ncbi:MAG: hypothetical protein ABR564_02945 [Candidatus Dormibacteria bacterium]
MSKTGFAAVIAALTLPLGVAACGSSGNSSPSTPPRPAANAYIERANFVRTVDNPWFPLKPGTTLRYRGIKDAAPTVDVVTVTHRTRDILGVPATVVHDSLYDDKGHVIEETFDWYAQDKRGNVWYLGEDTKELDAKGNVKSREGSWQTGKDGAIAGIFMPANPRVGQSFRQEYYKGQAEDHFKILSLGAGRMRTEETTPLEPDVVDNKYYVRGIGTVREVAVKGPKETNVLVSVKKG